MSTPVSMVLALLILAHAVGVAIAILWAVPPAVLESRLATPFAMGLVLALLGALAARRVRHDANWPGSGWALAAYATLGTSAVLAASGLISIATTTGVLERGAGERRSGSVAILAVNDVYRIEGLEGGAVGGLARLRTLRREVEREHPGRVLLLHGGDAIFPSFMSQKYGGQQMIDVLNLMDGDARPGRLDERMFVVLGNHEFEKESCKADPVLQRRIAEADFYWLHTNVSALPCDDRRPRLAGANLLQGHIVEVGGLRIGLFGLTIQTESDAFAFGDARKTARALVHDLRRRGADAVLAVTHLNWSDDLAMFEELRAEGLTLIIGGHDHVHMQLPKDAPEPRIFKADADARTAWVITLTVHPDGRVQAAGRLRTLDQRVAKDPVVDRRVAGWLRRHADEFCTGAAADSRWLGAKPVTGACLDEQLAVAETRLNASETQIRSRETSLGNWITDQMVAGFKDCRVDGAFVNAGGLRLNQDLAASSPILMRHLQELIQYPSALRVYPLSHAQFRRALENAVSEPDAGRWLQVSDQIAFIYRPGAAGGGGTLLKTVLRPANRPAMDVTATSKGKIRIVANEFLKNDPKNLDKFRDILPAPDNTACAAAGTDLKAILYTAFKAQGRIKSDEPGRICTEDEARSRACRANLSGNSP